jgi:acyl-CoA reductase-like NAD-dependent aldehyde dehydrogenase
MRFASDLQAGTVWVNEHMFLADGLPWGGFKESGFGKEGTTYGLDEYTQLKGIYVDISETQRRPWNEM